MFPFWNSTCWTDEPISRKTHQERKLRFLCWMRDDLEARLAGLNAAIATIERQINENNDTTTTV